MSELARPIIELVEDVNSAPPTSQEFLDSTRIALVVGGGALNHEVENRRIVTANRKDFMDFSDLHRPGNRRAGFGGQVWYLLLNQYARNLFDGNPIDPQGSEQAPVFPLRFATKPNFPTTQNEIPENLRGRGKRIYTKGLDDLDVYSLAAYVEILCARIKSLGETDGINSVIKVWEASRVRLRTKAVVEFLADFTTEKLGVEFDI